MHHTITNGRVVPGDIVAGDFVDFASGHHSDPLVLAGLRGTAARPIVVRAGDDTTRITGPLDKATARTFLRDEATRRAAGGHYPAVGHLGDLAALTLRDCHYVIVEGIHFRDTWPTALYIDDCRYIAVRDCRFEGATIGIGLNGTDTRNVLIEGNAFRQDMSADNALWNAIDWEAVHGSNPRGCAGQPVLNDDHRHLDGDFVRAWEIAGDLTVRDNDVCDTFNGIHIFARNDRVAAPGTVADAPYNRFRTSAVNVVIEDNRFTRVRDNVFEPEEHAWNWIIRRNRWVDCYLPFSFDLERAGWIYVYANEGAAIRKPSEKTVYKKRHGFAMFKTGSGAQGNEGPVLVAYNSFAFATPARYFRRGFYSMFHHFNNAVQYFDGSDGFFGSGSLKPGPGLRPGDAGPLAAELAAEQERFTRRWNGAMSEGMGVSEMVARCADLSIVMDGDLVNDPLYPKVYRGVGYPLGRFASGKSPNFEVDFSDLPTEAAGLTLRPQGEAARGTSVAVVVKRADGRRLELPAGLDRGAHQFDAAGHDALAALDAFLAFAPDTNWAEIVPRGNRPTEGPDEPATPSVGV